MYDKISFVKHFKPLNWYLGTGEYLDNAKEQVQEEILERLSTLKFGVEGYFFGTTFQGDPLFSEGRITVSSPNVWELTDPNGVKIIQEQKEAAKDPQGGFINYFWNKLNSNNFSPKVSFVMEIAEWEWIIGSGVYLDTIEQKISEKKAALIYGLKKNCSKHGGSCRAIAINLFLVKSYFKSDTTIDLSIFIFFGRGKNRFYCYKSGYDSAKGI